MEVLKKFLTKKIEERDGQVEELLPVVKEKFAKNPGVRKEGETAGSCPVCNSTLLRLGLEFSFIGGWLYPSFTVCPYCHWPGYYRQSTELDVI